MPRKKDEEDDDPLRRRQRKAHAASVPVLPRGDLQIENPLKLSCAGSDVLKPAKPIDYSRFNDIGKDTVHERLETGDVVWDELDKGQKAQVWEAENQMDAMLEKKRREEDEWKRQLREKPSDLSWVQGRHFASYETFCVGRVEMTLKKSGNDAFRRGSLAQARADWEGGISMLLALGVPPPEALDLVCVLRNNLAQLHVKTEEWNRVKELTDKILDRQPENEKALFRRSQAFFAMALWEKAEKDLEQVVRLNPANSKAGQVLEQVKRKLGKDKRTLQGKAVSDIAAGMAELAPDGTVRKLRIEEYGDGDPDARPDWIRDEWLRTEKSREKTVVTCQMKIMSHGGEELYNSKEYRPYPETKKARDELKEYMDMVNFLDQEAGKMPRLVGDFYQKVKKRPVRWHLGDPGMYRGFDLAVRTMKVGERALFEVDQPMLNESVEGYYNKLGFHSGLAGLPQLIYHIEEERLSILEDEVPEEELDIDSKTQRGVRVELQLLGYFIFKDLSPEGDGSRLHSVLHPGLPELALLKRGDAVRGAFFITRPFDGTLLVQNTYCEWRLGEDEGMYEKAGENKEPLRPGGLPFIPKCVGNAILQVDWAELRVGCLIEVRLRVGPELHEIAPQYAKQFEGARRENHRKGKKGGASCSILVQTFPLDGAEGRHATEPTTIETMNEEIPQDMDIE